MFGLKRCKLHVLANFRFLRRSKVTEPIRSINCNGSFATFGPHNIPHEVFLIHIVSVVFPLKLNSYGVKEF